MVSTGRPCKSQNARGGPCGAYAVAGSSYCFHHDPARAEERKLARIKGGKARHGRTLGGSAGDGHPVEIETVSDVVALLGRAVNDCLSLDNSMARARTVGYLCNIVVRVLEVADLEERLAALEREIAGYQPGSGPGNEGRGQ